MKNFLFSLVISSLMLFSAAESKMWEQLKGPYGFNAYDFVCDSKGNVFALTSTMGLIVSKDQGKSWEKLNINIKYPQQSKIYIDNSDIIYIYYLEKNLIFSEDSGVSWDSIDTYYQMNNRMIYSMKTLPNGDKILSSGHEIFKLTTDNTWKLLNVDTSAFYLAEIELAPDGQVFANTATYKIYYSTDNGENWSKFKKYLENDSLFKIFTFPSQLLIGMGYNAFYKSIDKGTTWEKMVLPVESEMFYDYTFTGDEEGNVYLLPHTYGIYKSSDKGQTWINIAANLADEIIQSIKIDNFGSLYSNISRRGIFVKKKNEENWEICHGNLIKNNNYRIFAAGDVLLTDAANLALHRSTDKGETWDVVKGKDVPNYILQFNNIGDYCFAKTYQNFFRSTDKGISWEVVKFDSSDIIPNSGKVFITKDSTILIAANDEFLISKDFFKTYTKAAYPDSVDYLYLDFETENEVYAHTFENVFYKSSDIGQTWNQYEINIEDINVIDFFGIDNNGVFILSGYSPDVRLTKTFYSYDKGMNWQLSHFSEWRNEILYFLNNMFFFKQDKFGYIQQEYGAPIIQIFNPYYSNSVINTMAVDSDGFVYIGTDNNGIFRSVKNPEDWNLLYSESVGFLTKHFCTSDSLKLSVRAYDTDLAPLENADVVFWYNNDKYKEEKESDSEGKALYQKYVSNTEFNTNSNPAPAPVIVFKEEYDNVYYHPFAFRFSQLLKMSINPRDTIDIEKGDSRFIDMVVTDCRDSVVPGSIVKVNDPIKQMSYNVVTYEAGDCKYKIEIPSDVSDGIYTYWFHATKNNYPNYESDENTYNIYVRVGNPNSVETIASSEALSVSPNPISGAATATVSLESDSFTQLDLYDIFGRKALAIHTGWLRQGESNITFDTGNLPAGMYFVKLQTSGGATAIPVIIER